MVNKVKQQAPNDATFKRKFLAILLYV